MKNYPKEKRILKLRDYIEKNFEFVGDKFSQKVREVYYDKKTKKVFMAQLHLKKKEKNLAEEGIDLLSRYLGLVKIINF